MRGDARPYTQEHPNQINVLGTLEMWESGESPFEEDLEPDWEAEALAEGDRRYSQMKDEGLI